MLTKLSKLRRDERAPIRKLYLALSMALLKLGSVSATATLDVAGQNPTEWRLTTSTVVNLTGTTPSLTS